MAGKPIATLGSMHVCPLCSGTVPHVGGPVTGPGAPNVLINGKPVAVMGDMCTCAGPPDTIVQGNPSVLINGVPVACAGDMTAHGGTITIGEANVLISTSKPNPKVTMPLKQIPFPKITVLDNIGAFIAGKSKSQSEAKENIEEIKKEADDKELEPVVYNIRMIHQDNVVNQTREEKKVLIVADVANASDGETVNFTISRMDENGKEDGQKFELSGKVKDGQVEIEWEAPKVELSEGNNPNDENELKDVR